jgi:hypothetical protein
MLVEWFLFFTFVIDHDYDCVQKPIIRKDLTNELKCVKTL